jgi:hypothetical protein
MEQLDAERDMAVIVPRALYFTTPQTFEADIERLERIYNKKEIVRNLKATKEPISNRVFELVADRYHVAAFHRFTRPEKSRQALVKNAK